MLGIYCIALGVLLVPYGLPENTNSSAHVDDKEVLRRNSSNSSNTNLTVPMVNVTNLEYRSDQSDDSQWFNKLFEQNVTPIEQLGCGFANPNGLDGAQAQTEVKHETKLAEYPWIVAIVQDGYFMGTGTLIAPNIVLTAASLVSATLNDTVVIAGEWDVLSAREMLPERAREVEHAIRHETKRYDIALLVLKMAFSRQPNIRTICLPSPGAVFDHSLCKSTAWHMPLHTKLSVNSFQVLPSAECAQRLPSPHIEDDLTLHPSKLCAAFAADSDSPTLNSGASLFCPMKGAANRYLQAGIVLVDVSRVQTGLFVNVPYFMPWIFQKLGPLAIDLKYYMP